MKFCQGCGEDKPAEEYYRSADSGDGLQHWCVDCTRRRRNGEKEYRPHDPDCRCRGCVKRINAIPGQRYCSICTLIVDEFTGSWCRTCSTSYAAKRRNRRTAEQRLRDKISRKCWTYGITSDALIAILDAQEWACVCGSPLSWDSLNIDHNHDCCDNTPPACGQCVRGALCTNCNVAIGMIKDDPERAMALAAYLWQFKDVLQLES